MIAITLKGKCTAIQVTIANGSPRSCVVTLELDHGAGTLILHPYNVQLTLPLEFATLFEIGLLTNLRLDQNGS